jgi:hypothetical protein
MKIAFFFCRFRLSVMAIFPGLRSGLWPNTGISIRISVFSEPSLWSPSPLLRIFKVSLATHLRPGSSPSLKSSSSSSSCVAGRDLWEFFYRSFLSKSLSNISNRPGEITVVRSFLNLNIYDCKFSWRLRHV